VCHLPFEEHDPSLLSTKHVALRTNYNTKIAQHKHTIQYKHNQTRQAIEKNLFNTLDLLIWKKECGLQDIDFRV
jgi:hypothetical protein